MNSATTPLFTPNPDAGQPKPKIVRANADVRYNEALDYLRLELKASFFKPIPSAEFSNTFKISHCFLAVLCAIGAIEKRTKKGEFFYKATERLWEIDATRVLKEKRILYPNKPLIRHTTTPDLTDFKVTDMSTFGPSAVIPVKAETAEEKPELFLVGVVSDSRLIISVSPKNTESKHQTYDEAMSYIDSIVVAPNEKIVLVKVLEVFEPVKTLQRSTL